MKSRFNAMFFLALLAGLISCNDELSEPQQKSFIKFYGSYQNDQGKDVVQLASGGYAILSKIIPPDSISKMALLMTNEFGNQIDGSPFYYGDSVLPTGGEAMLLLDDGGFLLGGYIEYPVSDNETQTDILLIRIDAEGEEVQRMTYGGAEDDLLNHIAKRSGGGYVIAGMQTEDEQEDAWVFMVDEQLNWESEFVGKDTDDDDQANFVMPAGNGYLCACTYDEGLLEGTDLFVVYIDNDCGIIDSRAMGTEFDEFAKQIVSYNNGYMIMGYTEYTENTPREIMLFTFSLEGNNIRNPQKFASNYPEGTDLRAESCVITSKGDIALLGSVNKDNDLDMFLMILDENGNIRENDNGEMIGYREFGGDNEDQTANAIKRTADGGLVFVGTNELAGDGLITLVKTNARGIF